VRHVPPRTDDDDRLSVASSPFTGSCRRCPLAWDSSLRAAAELTYASRWGPWGGELERVTCRGAYVERFMHAVLMGAYADLESTRLQSGENPLINDKNVK
jgi:hypothetical protein